MAQPPDFALLLTDGDSNHVPSAEEREQGYKTAADYGLTQKALSNFANEMMRKADRKAEKGTTYNKMPDGYSVWPCQRGGRYKRGKNPKMDWYIFGHPSGKKIDSLAQFVAHISFIQQPLQTGGCPCKVCKKHPVPEGNVARPDPIPATLGAPHVAQAAAEDNDGEDTRSDHEDGGDGAAEEDDGGDASAGDDDGEDTPPRMNADYDEERRRFFFVLLFVLVLLLAVILGMMMVGFSGS